eukprot:tig00021357_g20765.t1
MCGIFAYLCFGMGRKRRFVIDTLMHGLQRLEYRGYDSAGICIDADHRGGKPLIIKKDGKVSSLMALIQSMQDLNMDLLLENVCSIAHTRWATHGVPSVVNSHPHSSDKDNQFVVVHNGIITNYQPLKQMLVSKGFVFESETDTEVVAKLVKYIYDNHGDEPISFRDLVMEVMRELDGAYALLFMSVHFPNQLVACKRGSPLILGIKDEQQTTDAVAISYITRECGASFRVRKTDANVSPKLLGQTPSPDSPNTRVSKRQKVQIDGTGTRDDPVEYFFASDCAAIVEHTKRVLILEDDDVVHIGPGEFGLFRLCRTGASPTGPLSRVISTLEMEVSQIMKGNFPHFMLKEIYEQTESVVNTMRGRVLPDNRVVLGGLKDHVHSIRRSRRIILLGCGTSYNACVATRQTMEELCELPVVCELASDFLDRQCPIFRDDTAIFVSQSGETADTLRALEYAQKHGAFCIGVTNTVGSAIARTTHCGVHLNAGCEIGVASTKAYTSQIIGLVLVALTLSEDSRSKKERREQIMEDLRALPARIQKCLELDSTMKQMAADLQHEKSLVVCGRGYQFSTCLETALKVKELAYIHAEALAGGELKHGPIALIDPQLPVLLVATRDKIFDKVQNLYQQIAARAGKLFVVCTKPEDFAGVAHRVVEVPEITDCLQGIVNIVPLQLLAYHLAVLRGYNVDQPRNLAKSVTVE